MKLKLMYLYLVKVSYVYEINEVPYKGLVIAEDADNARLKFRRALRISDEYTCTEVEITKVKSEVFMIR